jgi:acetolactate synthase-1/2/3 large subunit
MIGTYGNRYANLAVANSDLLIALGTRFDTRQTGTKPETFARGAKKIHVDIDPQELNNKINVEYPINTDILTFLSSLTSSNYDTQKGKLVQWYDIINRFKSQYAIDYSSEIDQINPYAFFKILSVVIPDNAIVCVDVGQNQMWAAQTIELKKDQRLFTQGGMASIGSALPMAIGASFAQPDRIIVVIIGDGGFQLNIQELQTVFHHDLPIKIILLNNSGYGMIRQFQEQYFECRFQSSVIGYSNPDFQKVVSAYNIKSKKISSVTEIRSALGSLLNDPKPGFLEVIIDEKFRVIPKLAVNKPVEDQEPTLPREELLSNMIIDILPENDNS